MRNHARKHEVFASDPHFFAIRTGQSKKKRKLAEMPSRTLGSIDEDTKFLLDRFAACGLNQIIVVDFTPPTLPYSVVRVIVPGIELWATDHGRLGPRAVEFWKEHA